VTEPEAFRWPSNSGEVFKMSHSALPPEIRGLSVPERVALVEQIWDSIVEDEAKFQLTDAQKAELDRRLARRKSSTSPGLDWAEVKARILGES
jgi:putative addiction module component (TIGR02574 family)